METVQNWSATVRRLEEGFFLGHCAAPMASPFSTRQITGFPSRTQFFRVQVDVNDCPEACGEIWMVCTATPTGNRAPPPGTTVLSEANLATVRAALAAALPEVMFCFTTEDREGLVRTIGNPSYAASIAAGVAVVKYYAAWDESDPIRVLVYDESFDVSVMASEDMYRASVRRAPALHN
jgi:hypothetical protein